MNSKLKSLYQSIHYSTILLFLFALLLSSCSKKPAEYYRDGMASFLAGNYAEAQATFAKGIKDGGSDSLYAGFVASNLVTGKYPQVTAAYNKLSESIHRSLTELYGRQAVSMLGITTDLIPYNVNGRNKIPPDFPQIVMLQRAASYREYLALKQEVENQIRN